MNNDNEMFNLQDEYYNLHNRIITNGQTASLCLIKVCKDLKLMKEKEELFAQKIKSLEKEKEEVLARYEKEIKNNRIDSDSDLILIKILFNDTQEKLSLLVGKITSYQKNDNRSKLLDMFHTLLNNYLGVLDSE